MNRKVDDLGRIVIPMEIRKRLGIKPGDSLNIELKDNQIILFNENTLQERINKAIDYINNHDLFKMEIDKEELFEYASDEEASLKLVSILKGEDK